MERNDHGRGKVADEIFESLLGKVVQRMRGQKICNIIASDRNERLLA